MFKTIAAQLAALTRSRRGRRNIRVLLRFFLVLAAMITVYSVAFHFIMQREGRDYSWITGLYWTLTVMSTLGLGDIFFESDLGWENLLRMSRTIVCWYWNICYDDGICIAITCKNSCGRSCPFPRTIS